MHRILSGRTLQLAQSDEASEKMWVSAVERLPEKIERFTSIIKKRDWAELFVEAKEKAKRIEEKLEVLSKRIMKPASLKISGSFYSFSLNYVDVDFSLDVSWQLCLHLFQNFQILH
jgi:acyl carrier protein phosphodiesterase